MGYKAREWHDLVNSLTTKDGFLWRIQKALRKPKTTMQPLHGRNGIVDNRSDKLDAFADHLQHTHAVVQSEPFKGDDEFEKTIEATISLLPDLSENR